MRLKLNLVFFFCFVVEIAFSQSITLVPTNPANPSKGTVDFNNTTNQLQYWNGTAWVPITNAASGTGWGLNGTHIYNSNSGNVGIGITNPTAKLHIKTETGSYGMLHTDGNISVNTYVGSGYAWLGTNSNHPLVFSTNNSNPLMTIGTNGNVGVGVTSPNFKLDVSDRIRLRSGSVSNTAGLWLNNPDNSATIAFLGTAGATTAGIFGLNSGWGVTLNTSNGYVGIGNSAVNSTNKLQIGSVTNAFIGNDLAIGNGTNTMSIYQSNTSTKISSTTDIYFNPRNNGAGRVGINTETPRAPLEVSGFVATSLTGGYVYFKGDVNNPYDLCDASCTGYFSIYASNAIAATEFDAFSDVRIKDIIGVSNSGIDLETIKALQITDYTLKDKIKNGNKPYKKVIAQQVEKFYPQAVNKSTEVVPDIYTLAEKVVFDEECKNLSISLSKGYDIKIGEKIEFIHEKEGKIKAEVVAVSGNSFTVKDWKYPTNNIFVYGREVNDFRSVDYEAISMLGISAIQELAKKNDELETEIKKLKSNNQQLNTRLEIIENLVLKSQNGKQPNFTQPSE